MDTTFEKRQIRTCILFECLYLLLLMFHIYLSVFTESVIFISTVEVYAYELPPGRTGTFRRHLFVGQ